MLIKRLFIHQLFPQNSLTDHQKPALIVKMVRPFKGLKQCLSRKEKKTANTFFVPIVILYI